MGDESQPDETTAPSDAGMPDWLAGASEESEPATGSATAPDADVPSWLMGDESQPDETTAPSDASMPDWLAGAESQPASPDADTESDVRGGLPPWLGQDDADAGGLEAPAIPGDLSLPEWLHGADADIASMETTAKAPMPTSDTDADAAGSFGSWFDNDEPDAAPSQSQPADQTTDTTTDSSIVGGVDLPAWLRPTTPAPAAAPEEKQPEQDWMDKIGPAEEEEVAEPEPTIKIPLPTYRRSPAQMEAAQLLQKLIATPYPEAAPVPQPAAPPLLQQIGLDRILYVALTIALLLCVLFPSMTGMFQYQDINAAPGADNASAVFEKVENLTEDDTVLLAYEWDGKHTSELGALEHVVTEHLMDRKAHMLLMSTDPQGTILSFDMGDRLQESKDYLGEGADYLRMGYFPGGELALRAMGQDFLSSLQTYKGEDASGVPLAYDLETMEPKLQTISDLSLIIVMADQMQDVQAWMEHVYPYTSQVPIVLLLPSEVEPLIRPYLKHPNVYHVAGKQAAILYTSLVGTERQDDAIITAAAQASGQYHVAIIVFMLLTIIGTALGPLAKYTEPLPSHRRKPIASKKAAKIAAKKVARSEAKKAAEAAKEVAAEAKRVAKAEAKQAAAEAKRVAKAGAKQAEAESDEPAPEEQKAKKAKKTKKPAKKGTKKS